MTAKEYLSELAANKGNQELIRLLQNAIDILQA